MLLKVFGAVLIIFINFTNVICIC